MVVHGALCYASLGRPCCYIVIRGVRTLHIVKFIRTAEYVLSNKGELLTSGNELLTALAIS